MEEFRFHHGSAPAGFKLDFEESLFNREAHRTLQSTQGWNSFHILNDKNKKISASIHFQVTHELAKSPLRGPFGSLEFANSLPGEVVFRFLEFVVSELKKINVAEILIKDAPLRYRPDHASLLHTFLLNLGFQVAHAEVGTVIEVRGQPLETLVHPWEKRRLKQAQQWGLICKRLPHTSLHDVYEFIRSCRANKGYELSMTHDNLKQAMDTFPDAYMLFGVFENDKLAGAAVTIRVKENILYNFYADHDPAFDHLSPVVLLIDNLYTYCWDNGISIFDLGTSAHAGLPNFSLLDFKMHVGGKPTPKLTFVKKINHG